MPSGLCILTNIQRYNYEYLQACQRELQKRAKQKCMVKRMFEQQFGDKNPFDNVGKVRKK